MECCNRLYIVPARKYLVTCWVCFLTRDKLEICAPNLASGKRNIGINQPHTSLPISVLRSSTQMFWGNKHRTLFNQSLLLSPSKCCATFVQIVHLGMHLWFTSHQQGVLSKSLLFKAALYCTCHFTSQRKNTRFFYWNVISEWKCKRKKTICGNQKQTLCLQSICLWYMKKIPFSISILPFHISWCASYSKSVPHWSLLSVMNT